MDVEGEGRVVITASRAAELAYEETGAVDGRPPRSFFMNAIVTGIDTGGADRDNDGRISVFELYDYVYEQMEAVRTLQQPSWQGRGVGSLHIAWRRGRRTIEARTIPGPPVIVDTTIPSPRVAQVDHVRVVPILLPRPRGRAHAFRVQRWLYRVGDIVGQGTPLLEIEAGGTMYDVESPAAGTLRGISAVEGELVDSMATVGIIVIGGSNRVPAQRAVPKIGPRPVRTAVVQLPSLVGAGSATVKVWWRRIGDRIERGEALLQIAMGAIVVDITSAESGTLRAISVVEGEAAVEGETVAVIALD
jgi:biotin carboxyl carrier protein